MEKGMRHAGKHNLWPYEAKELIIMAVEEYETIRLIDHEGLTQEECAERMNVARTTVQGIYSRPEKLADFLVHGGVLRIEGGDYKLCEDRMKGMVVDAVKGKDEDEICKVKDIKSM